MSEFPFGFLLSIGLSVAAGLFALYLILKAKPTTVQAFIEAQQKPR